jgi:sugar phosphate isomerase/epimerase
MTMHPRVCVSAISTFKLDLAADLDFWATHDIDCVGVSVAKLAAFGWEEGTRRIADAVGNGLRVANLIGLGPFVLSEPRQWERQRERLARVLEAGRALAAECVVFTTGPAGQLPWDEAADALEAALAPVLVEARAIGIPFAVEHTNSLRVDVGFVHSLHDVVDLARRLGTGVCMEVNACWAERGLAETIAAATDVIGLVQVSDFAVGTLATPDRLVPGDGDIPLARILGQVVAAGYGGVFDLELIGPKIDAEGYSSAVPRAVAVQVTRPAWNPAFASTDLRGTPSARPRWFAEAVGACRAPFQDGWRAARDTRARSRRHRRLHPSSGNARRARVPRPRAPCGALPRATGSGRPLQTTRRHEDRATRRRVRPPRRRRPSARATRRKTANRGAGTRPPAA